MEIKTIDRVFYKEMARQLNHKRSQRNISLRALAKRTGKSYQAMDNYFLGKTKMSEETFKNLCRILNFEPKLKVTVSLE